MARIYLSDCVEHRSNNITLLRLILAWSVLFMHLVVFSASTTLHWPAMLKHHIPVVSFFFFMSGFLVTRSYFVNSPIAFVVSRLLRIYPGLIFALFVTLILAAVCSGQGFLRFFTQPEPWQYFLAHVNLLSPRASETVLNVFSGNPYPGLNVPLRTLFIEMKCYLLLLVFGQCRLLKYRWVYLVVASTLIMVLKAKLAFTFWMVSHSHPDHFLGGYPAIAFFIGSLVYLFRDMIYLNVCLACVIFLAAFHAGGVIQLVSVCYVLLYLAYSPTMSFLPLLKFDCSYGVYVLAFPISQAMIYSQLPFGFTELLVAVSVVTILLAILMRALVEMPFLRLKPMLAAIIQVWLSSVTDALKHFAEYLGPLMRLFTRN